MGCLLCCTCREWRPGHSARYSWRLTRQESPLQVRLLLEGRCSSLQRPCLSGARATLVTSLLQYLILCFPWLRHRLAGAASQGLTHSHTGAKSHALHALGHALAWFWWLSLKSARCVCIWRNFSLTRASFVMRSGILDKSGRRHSLASQSSSMSLGRCDSGASGRASSSIPATATAAAAAGDAEAVTEACVLSENWMLLLQALSQVLHTHNLT